MVRTHFNTKETLERDKKRSRLRSRFRRLLDRAATLQGIVNHSSTNEITRETVKHELKLVKEKVLACEKELKDIDNE